LGHKGRGVEERVVTMSDLGGLEGCTHAQKEPWSSVELIVDGRRSPDPNTRLGEWQRANVGWSVSCVLDEEVIARALESLPSDMLRSWLSTRPDLALELGRVITLANDARKVSIKPDLPASDLSLMLESSNGCIVLNGDRSGIDAIALPLHSLIGPSITRVTRRLIEDRDDVPFLAIVDAVTAAGTLLGLHTPRMLRYSAKARNQGPPWQGWMRSARQPRINGRSGWPGTRRSQLGRLALAEIAALIVEKTYRHDAKDAYRRER
jgi:hypothetical protein